MSLPGHAGGFDAGTPTADDRADAGRRSQIEGLRLARGLLDQYEALWRGRVERMTDLITSSKEIDA